MPPRAREQSGVGGHSRRRRQPGTEGMQRRGIGVLRELEAAISTQGPDGPEVAKEVGARAHRPGPHGERLASHDPREVPDERDTSARGRPGLCPQGAPDPRRRAATSPVAAANTSTPKAAAARPFHASVPAIPEMSPHTRPQRTGARNQPGGRTSPPREVRPAMEPWPPRHHRGEEAQRCDCVRLAASDTGALLAEPARRPAGGTRRRPSPWPRDAGDLGGLTAGRSRSKTPAGGRSPLRRDVRLLTSGWRAVSWMVMTRLSAISGPDSRIGGARGRAPDHWSGALLRRGVSAGDVAEPTRARVVERLAAGSSRRSGSMTGCPLW